MQVTDCDETGFRGRKGNLQFAVVAAVCYRKSFMVAASSTALVKKLSRMLGPERVLSDPNSLIRLSQDAFHQWRAHPNGAPHPVTPWCAVFPESTAEVRDIVRIANEEKMAVVPYGGGSGLMGAAASVRRGIVVDLGRMNRVVEVSREDWMARVQAGVVLESLEQRLCREGAMLGHDPWTLPVATVGGTISTDSLGYRGGKYGSMGEQVLGLEAVLPTGEILRTRALPKTSTGMNLNQILIGGEGCFGIITEATLRIFPIPERRALFAFHFRSFEDGFRAIQKIFAHGLKPSLLDFGEYPPKGSLAVLFLGFEGFKETVQTEAETGVKICAELGGMRRPDQEAERFWHDRHAVARRFLQNREQRRERLGDRAQRDWIHVALPASQILRFRALALAMASQSGTVVEECGLWTRPELFSMRLAAGTAAGPQSLLESTLEELLRKVHELGGSMEYCHGVGVKLAPLMAAEHGVGLDVMRRIKRALDPNGIMNPDKMGL